MTRADTGNRGKWAEKQVADWLTLRSNSDLGFAWMRFPDAKSARGALAAQPADFKVASKGAGCWHLEVKETAQQLRLPKAKIRQYGLLKKWYLAGLPALVVVYLTEIDRWTYLDSVDLFSHDECPASFKLKNPMVATLDLLMTAIFGAIRH